MPWTSGDASGHTKRASTAAQKKRWAAIANDVLGRTGDDARAIRIADAALKDDYVEIKKLDAELQVVWGEVYAPGFPDSQGDFMTRESIREMAWRFMKQSQTNAIDVRHDQLPSDCYVVESFVARDDDQVFIPGSWVLGVKIPDATLWNAVKSGELNSFSLDGIGYRIPRQLEFDLDGELSGMTAETQGHAHQFVVKFDESGNFLGGQTAPGGSDGHVHRILRGTCTEVAPDGHSHRFSFLEGLLSA